MIYVLMGLAVACTAAMAAVMVELRRRGAEARFRHREMRQQALELRGEVIDMTDHVEDLHRWLGLPTRQPASVPAPDKPKLHLVTTEQDA